jgi:hypothetical protein
MEPHSVPVGTSKKRPPGDSQRARRRDITQGTNVPHDSPANVPVRLSAGGHEGVIGVQMACMRPVLAPRVAPYVTLIYKYAYCTLTM